MERNFVFNSQITSLGQLPDFPQDIIKNETMFFNASPEFVAEQDNIPITTAFLARVEEFLQQHYDKIPPVVIDTRVHMLMKGWYPCIPGFHHDDVCRSYPSNQPDYHKMPYKAKHIMGLVNGKICPTEFAIGKVPFPDIEEGEMYYKKWHPIVEDYCNLGLMKRREAIGNEIILFDWESFHQGQVAREGGWRWFGRVSWDTDRTKLRTNEIRRQVNCYLPAPMEGW